jgi:hypothetical protein
MIAGMDRRWAVLTAAVGTVFIAAGAFWLSFTALADLAARSGIGAGQSWAWPLIVDGIIVVATVAVVALGGQRSAWYPWTLLIGGALVSVTANAIHAVVAADADVPGVLAAAVAAVPPVVLLAITHLTVVLTRPTTGPARRELQRLGEKVAPARDDHAPPAQHLTPLAVRARTSESDVARAAPDERPSGDRRMQAAAFREARWSYKRIARELGVHASTVGRWFAAGHLADGPDSPTSTNDNTKEQ